MSWVTIREASGYLKVSRSTLYRWARDGRIRLHRLGRRTVRVRKEELDRISDVASSSEIGTLGTRVTPQSRIWKLVGLGEGPKDLAVNHDRHLARAIDRKRR